MSNKFKAGDKVRCITDNAIMRCKETETSSKSPWKKGYKMEVLKVDGEGRFMRSGDHTSWHYEHHFELVEEYKVQKFKVGDKVRAKDSCFNDFSNGEGIIEEIEYSASTDTPSMTIRVTKKSSYYEVGNLTCNVDWTNSIELITPKKQLINNNMTETTFDDVKKMPKAVLKEANEQVLEEIANEQIDKAKLVIRKAYEEKRALEEQTSSANAKLKELNIDLKAVNA